MFTSNYSSVTDIGTRAAFLVKATFRTFGYIQNASKAHLICNLK